MTESVTASGARAGRRRLEWLAAACVLAALTLFLFHPIVSGAATGGPRFFEWDVPEQYWPDQVFLCSNLSEGRLPLWNPWDRGGYPVHGDPQAASWHPVSWAICALGGASPAPGWMTARVLLGFFAAGLFGLLWLRRLGLAVGPALVGAAVIETAPFMRHNWELNLTFGLAWLPLMLWAADRVAVERRLRDGAWLALATALCVWAGSPPAAWLAGTFTAGWLLARAIPELRREGRGAVRPLARALGAAAALAAALTAVVLVPGAQLAASSVQAGRDLESIAAGALAPADLVALVSPRPGNHLYVGLVALVLGLGVLLEPRGRRLPGRWFLSGAAVLAVLMTLGAATPLFPLLAELPGFGTFRLPHRYEAWLGPAMGALAAGGLAASASHARWRWTGGLLVATLLVGLQAIDVSSTLPPDRHTRAGEHPGLDLAALELAPGTDGPWRYLDEFGVSCRSGARLGRRDLRGYQDPLQLRSYERVIGSLREHPRLAEQLSVRFALTGPHFIHGWDRHYLPPPEELLAIPGARDRGRGVIELPSPVPSAWWTPAAAVEFVPDRQTALRRTMDVAPAMVAIVEGEPVAPPTANDLLPRPARSFELEADRVRVGFEAPGPGFVVVNEAWYPGWTATVDGVPADVVRANGFVRAVAVPAGASELMLAYRPLDGQPLRWLLLAGLLCCGALLLRAGSSLEVRDDEDGESAGDDVRPDAGAGSLR
jgi:hypothetical protein